MKGAHKSEEKSDPAHEEGYVLRLYITGASVHSARAVENIQRICDVHLANNCKLEVIDVHQQGELAREEQIFALPLLIRKFPLPERRMIGDLSDTDRVLKGLGLKGVV